MFVYTTRYFPYNCKLYNGPTVLPHEVYFNRSLRHAARTTWRRVNRGERVKVVEGSWLSPLQENHNHLGSVCHFGWFPSWVVIVCLTGLRASSVIGWGVQWFSLGKLYRLIFFGSWTSKNSLVGATCRLRWGHVEATVRLVGNLVLSDAHADAMETKIDQPISELFTLKSPKIQPLRKISWQTGDWRRFIWSNYSENAKEFCATFQEGWKVKEAKPQRGWSKRGFGGILVCARKKKNSLRQLNYQQVIQLQRFLGGYGPLWWVEPQVPVQFSRLKVDLTPMSIVWSGPLFQHNSAT